MYKLKIERADGQILTLTQDESNYQIIDVDGFNPPKAQVNITGLANFDGGKFNSAKLDTRALTLTVKINGDIEKNRLRLYSYVAPKSAVKVYYKNGSRDIYAEGRVETVECTAWTNGETAQIFIICPDSYLKSVEEMVVDISNTVALFEFPFYIDLGDPIAFSEYVTDREVNVLNDSEAETGVVISIVFAASVSEIEIRNVDTGEFIKLVGTYVEDDRVVINTNKGSKTVRLIRNGVTTNIFSNVQSGSTFFQLLPGDNIFSYLADAGASNIVTSVVFSFRNRYMGA